MKTNQQQMTGAYIKEARLAKGYTQKELSDLSNVSVRSIQRIENGDIVPRSYTLKTLYEVLGLSFEKMQAAVPALKPRRTVNREQKLILSVAVPAIVLLGVFAFIAQSNGTPETTFETLVLIAVTVIVITIALIYLWRL